MEEGRRTRMSVGGTHRTAQEETGSKTMQKLVAFQFDDQFNLISLDKWNENSEREERSRETLGQVDGLNAL